MRFRDACKLHDKDEVLLKRRQYTIEPWEPTRGFVLGEPWINEEGKYPILEITVYIPGGSIRRVTHREIY